MAAFVSLIGAGPGDPELITLRGQRALAAAEVIIYDDLVDRRLLIPFADRPVYGLGDRRAPAPERQQRLYRLLAEQAAAGRRVAHLKGGDPLLFARGAEEIRFLRAAGIPYEVIPGITAAVAAAAYAELPLTRRRQASSVAFCTGHTEVAVPVADTLVYYMAAARMAVIAKQLLARGWSPATAVTLIRNASRPDQSVTTLTLSTAARRDSLAPPLVAVIGPGGAPVGAAGRGDPPLPMAGEGAPPPGPGASARNEQPARAAGSWFSRARKVLVTGTSAEPYRRLGEVVHTPLIRIAGPSDWGPLDAALDQLAGYSIVALTSRYAVTMLVQRLLARGADGRRLAHARLAVVGAATAAALRAHGLAADLVAQPETGAGLLAALRAAEPLAGVRVLLPRSQLADAALPEALGAAGAAVTAVTAYRTLPVAAPVQVNLAACDAVLFTSPSTVQAFRQLYGTALPAQLQLWCRGPRTRAAAHAAFGRGEPLPGGGARKPAAG